MKINSVPFFRMKFTAAEKKAVSDVIDSGWLTTGHVTRELESRFAQWVGSKYASAVSSCTAGLILGLKGVGIGKGDEVITTPFTFVASVEAIIHAGARPVFADIDARTLNIDPARIEDRITSKTKAIMPVHIAGLPCRMDVITKIARKHKLKIVQDSAHAIGAHFRNKPIASYGDFSSFSFYATKNLTTGEGGMVTTDNKGLAENIQILSLHGMDRKAWRRYLDQGSWYYEVVELGHKFNLPDINAALGLAMLKRLDALQKKRARVAGWYNQELSKFEEIELPVTESDSRHAWHLYIIRLSHENLKIDRDQFIRSLTEKNVGTSVNFIPMFMHPYYRGKYGLKAKKYPACADAYRRVISLPFFPDLRRDEVRYVAKSIGDILARNRKV